MVLQVQKSLHLTICITLVILSAAFVLQQLTPPEQEHSHFPITDLPSEDGDLSGVICLSLKLKVNQLYIKLSLMACKSFKVSAICIFSLEFFNNFINRIKELMSNLACLKGKVF